MYQFQVISGGYVIFTTPLCDSFVELVLLIAQTLISIIQIQKVMKCICLGMKNC